MSQEQRVIVFILVVFSVLIVSQRIWQPPKPLPLPDGSGELAATTGPARLQAPDESPAPAPAEALPRDDEDALPAELAAGGPPVETITVRTRDFEIEIDPRGARPRRWDIVAPELVRKDPHSGEIGAMSLIPTLVSQRAGGDLPLELSLTEMGRQKFPEVNQAVYDCRLTTDATGMATLVCVSPELAGQLRVTKTFRFPWDSFLVDLKIEVENLDTSSRERMMREEERGLGVTWGPGIGQYDPNQDSRVSGLYYITAAAAQDGVVRDVTPKEKGITDLHGKAQWIALRNKYFMAALLPKNESAAIGSVSSLQRPRNALPEAQKKKQSPPHTIIGYTDAFRLMAGEKATFEYQIFVGPLKRDTLAGTNHDLDRVLFHTSWGWFRGLVLALMWLLERLYALSHSYGLAIILLTVVVKVATHPLTHKSMKLNAKTQMEMGRIKPEIEELNRKYKDDFQARNKAMMEIYKKHGINPMAPLRGCLPMLIQMPIFIALWRLLDASVEIRGVEFLWMTDLSQADQLFKLPFTIPLLGWQYFNLLPVLMAITTVITQLMSATQISDPNQKMMLYLMPVMMLVMLYSFSSGLFVYWITSNIWQMAHQYVTTRIFKSHVAPAAAAPARRN